MTMHISSSVIFKGRGLDITSTFYKSRSKITHRDEFVLKLDADGTVKGELMVTIQLLEFQPE